MHLQLYDNMFMMPVKSHPEMRSGKNSIMFGYVLFCHCIDMSQISIKDINDIDNKSTAFEVAGILYFNLGNVIMTSVDLNSNSEKILTTMKKT